MRHSGTGIAGDGWNLTSTVVMIGKNELGTTTTAKPSNKGKGKIGLKTGITNQIGLYLELP